MCDVFIKGWCLEQCAWYSQEGQSWHLWAPLATLVNISPQTSRQPSWGADTSNLSTSREHFSLHFRKKGGKKINTFPFSELMSNGLEMLPLGAQAIEQSSISSSSSDSSISAATGAGGQAPTTANLECQHLCPDPFDNSLCWWQTQNYSLGKVKPALVWRGPSADYTDITTRGKCVL